MDEFGDRLRRLVGRIEGGFKAILTPGMLFEALGFKYYGPVNGHNVQQLVNKLKFIKDELNGPVLLHVTTMKGKGYKPAEEHKQFLHAIGSNTDKITGKPRSQPSPTVKPSPPKYEQVFGKTMIEICDNNPKVVGITAAMPSGTGLSFLQQAHPEKVFDVGIAEGHAVTFAAGLAAAGIVPVCAIYSSFLQRAFDNIAHDCAIQNLHVVFAIDRSGLVGADGPTHHGVLDLAYLRIIQGMVVMAPKDEQELRNMLHTAINCYKGGPIAIRYPRGASVGVETGPMKELPIGKGETLRKGSTVAIVAIGKMVAAALDAADRLAEAGIDAEVVNARFVKPLDTELIDDLCLRFDKIITVEDGQKQGGFGSAVLEYVTAHHSREVDVLVHGIDDIYVPHGTQDELLHDLFLDGEGITKVTQQWLYNSASITTSALVSS